MVNDRQVSTVYSKVSGLSHGFKQSRCIPDLKDEALCKASCLIFPPCLEWDKSVGLYMPPSDKEEDTQVH